ncbi:MAG: aldo/keto reductase [Acidobacteria bacterium]|nr:aldo/keto reductase [Acidobacteriota bacterium]
MSQTFYRLAQGMRLSSLGIGTYLGPMDDATDASYEAAIRAAIEGGINVIDTSRNYRGERSERAIGRVISKANRDELVVCTKAGYYIDRRGHSLAPDFLEENLHASLVNLATPRVEIFYLHNPETQLQSVPAEDFYSQIRNAFERCESMAASGLLRFYGVATWDAFRTGQNTVSLHRLVAIAREIAGQRHRFRFVQLPFNLAMLEGFNKRWQEGGMSLLQAAAELGITVVGSATVLQGRLTRGLPEALTARFNGLATDAQRSIQFSRSTPGLAVSLVGMSAPAHVVENLAVKEVAPLSEREYYAIYGR